MDASIFGRFAPAGLSFIFLLNTCALRAETRVTQQGQTWTLENAQVKVSFDAQKGTLSVLDKAVNYLYRQPPEPSAPPTPAILIPKTAAPIQVDGNLDDWRLRPVAVLTFDMTPDGNWKNVKGNSDCSALLYAAWDEKNLYLAARVLDERLVWGEQGRERWWERDSLEFWVGARQVGLNLTENGVQARTASSALEGRWQAALKVVPNLGNSSDMKLITQSKPNGGRVADSGGYIVEAAFPWSLFPDVARPAIGAKVRFAFGVNDADETGEREGQLYFPATWVHSRPETFAEATLADPGGRVPAAPAKKPIEAAKVRNVAALAEPAKGISYEVDAPGPQGRKLPVIVKLSLADEAPDLTVEFDMPNRDSETADFSVLEPLVLDSPQGHFAVADYGNGHLYPLDDPKVPRKGGSTDRLDMPWIGVVDMTKGFGYILIVDTSDDGAWRMKTCQLGERALLAPQIVWRPEMGKFGYPRRLLYHFTPSGGYVALAKYYREYAKARGLIVPFTEKIKKNPDLERLFGAPDIWGAAGLKFCRLAKSLGVDRMLVNGRFSPEDMQEINRLGYLTSEYDNYTDILQVEPGKEVSSNRAHLPDDVVKLKDGSEMKAWLTYDKKTQFMKRCPSLWVPTARNVIKKVLEKYPYLARFIDVTTAEGLYECYDPKHPLTRRQKRQCGVDLLATVREFGLVVGGEHGIWWGVPVQDYVEGMMSGGFAAWPAGHLQVPKKIEELTQPDWKVKCSSWEDYLKYGIGHETRVPLWELVFHDCIVTTWYWGDSTDFLLNVAPENSEKKDAFNILYGTVPLMWVGTNIKPFEERKEQFLRSYRNTCKLHEVIACDEMLSHEFLTPDRAVQRTRFSSGTECTVNFGQTPYTIAFEGKEYVLPTYGFFVHGPKVLQYLALVDGKRTTYIQTPDYVFADGHGQAVATRPVSVQGAMTIRLLKPDTLRLICDQAQGTAVIRPKAILADWDISTTKLYALNEDGARIKPVPFTPEGDALRLTVQGLRCVEAICKDAARYADFLLEPAAIKLSSAHPKQGDTVALTIKVTNIGLSAASAKVEAFLDEAEPERLLLAQDISLAPGEEKELDGKIETRYVDGHRYILVWVDRANAVTELSKANNSVTCDLDIAIDASLWPYKVRASVMSGDLERVDYPVTLPIDLADLARRAGAQGAINPNTLRVVECDAEGKPRGGVPCQFDPSSDTSKGEMCWLLVGRTPPNTSRAFFILFDTDPQSKMTPAPGVMWNSEQKAITTPVYRVVFEEGVIKELYNKLGSVPERSLVTSIILSSDATGWAREEGTLNAFEVRHDGPARTVIWVKKTLVQDHIYEKTFIFYPRWFEVETKINKPVGGLYSRTYYALQGQYEDDKGCKAFIDGQGSGEEVYGKNRNPLWYCVYTPEWAHSCVALSPMSSIAYWDGGAMGGVGFHAPGLSGAKIAYVFHPGQKDANFAKMDYQQLTRRPAVRLD